MLKRGALACIYPAWDVPLGHPFIHAERANQAVAAVCGTTFEKG
jgi:hypothetical protein